MRVVLTGCSGYIGTRLAKLLTEAGHSVVGIDRVPYTGSDLQDFVLCDLVDEPQKVGSVCRGADLIAHLAAAKGDWGISDEEYYRDNVDATRNLIAAGRRAGVKRWIFYSSVAAMGPGEVARSETADLAPSIAYGKSKAEAEALFHELAAVDPECSVLTIRPSVVFGPGNPESTNVYRLIEAIQTGRFVMIGRGEVVKTTSYIENLLAATLFLMDRMSEGVQTYIYVDAPVMPTGELVDHLYRMLGKVRPRFYLPLWLVKPLAAVMDIAASLTGIDFPITAARIEKFCTPTNFDGSAIRRLGFKQPVRNEQALANTVRWHLSRNQGITAADALIPELEVG